MENEYLYSPYLYLTVTNNREGVNAMDATINNVAEQLGFVSDKYYTAKEKMLFHPSGSSPSTEKKW